MKLEKWERWIKIIKHDLSDLLIAKNIYWQLIEIANKSHKSYSREVIDYYLNSTYLSHVALSIRRQVRPQNGSVSLVGLLSEIRGMPKNIEREWFISKYPVARAETAHIVFDDYGDKFVDSDLIELDITRLQDKAKVCENYADKRVAHLDKKKSVGKPTLLEIEACVETLEIICTKYYFLLFAEHAEYLPDYRDPNLENVFSNSSGKRNMKTYES